mmetsp:Transcript_36983/g.56659  ORF Transcript_36983/g.56659 Transcript_36983/m.56659 type:complete len:82 (+) Transcript_36983:992-1237(+)
MRLRMEKVESQMHEMKFQHKKEADDATDRYQHMCNSYDKQIRELRTQVNMKGKDLHNQKEEVADLETRFSQKQTELKSLRG